jgi:hypothetical protein
LIVDFLYFACVHGLDVDGLVFEPAQVVCHQMDVVASAAAYEYHTFVVGVFGERTDGFGVALGAAETEDVHLAVLGLDPGNTVEY